MKRQRMKVLLLRIALSSEPNKSKFHVIVSRTTSKNCAKKAFENTREMSETLACGSCFLRVYPYKYYVNCGHTNEMKVYVIIAVVLAV